MNSMYDLKIEIRKAYLAKSRHSVYLEWCEPIKYAQIAFCDNR